MTVFIHSYICHEESFYWATIARYTPSGTLKSRFLWTSAVRAKFLGKSWDEQILMATSEDELQTMVYIIANKFLQNKHNTIVFIL
jgi:hypothetical protein